MYAVIKTGGKQYRVKAGDVLVVEKLDGEPGAKVAFDQVLMVGEGSAVTVGAPTIAGASVSATLIETRRGEKIKIFKKTRRQGYRRTGGHRQTESVLRVTAVAGGGKTETWDIETGPPNTLYRNGWRKDFIKPGEEVVVVGTMAKNGTNTVNARTVKTPDGRTLLAGSSENFTQTATPQTPKQ